MTARQWAVATVCSVLVATLAWGDPPPGKGRGKGPDRDDHADLGPSGPGKGPKGKKGPGARTAFLPAERDRIWTYYHAEHGPGPGGPGGMPPGWQKQLVRNGHLPPGIEKKLQPLPPPLITELPPIPVGYTRYRVDTRVLLVQDATRLVLDIIDLAAR